MNFLRSVFYSRINAARLDLRQREEFFLTAAQSLFGLALLLCLRLSLKSAFALLGLFLVQFGLAFYFHNDESRTIVLLTFMAWLYLVLAAGIFFWNRRCLIECVQAGLLARTSPETKNEPLTDTKVAGKIKDSLGGREHSDSAELLREDRAKR